MNQKFIYLFTFLVIIIFQCTEKEKGYVIDILWSKRDIFKNKDEFNLIINKKRDSDSIYLYQNVGNNKIPDFQIIIDNNMINYCSNSDTVQLTQLGIKKIEVYNKEYVVYNLIRFSPNENDGAVNFFITKEFGIINILNSANMKIGMVQFSENKIQKIIKNLNSQLMVDSNFYFYNNNLPPLP